MPEKPKIADEIKRMQAEPLLPVEKKLIIGSLVLGVVLLGVLVWVSQRYFPVTPSRPTAEAGERPKLVNPSMPLPTFLAKQIATDFEVTGRLSNPLWAEAAPVLIERSSADESARPELATVVRALWSDKYLYLGYTAPFVELTVFEPANLQEKRIGLWERDVVEAFIGSDLARTNRYAEFEVAPNGEWLDLMVDLPEKDFTWKSGFQAAVHADSAKKTWDTEMRIPLHSLAQTPPVPGTRWRLNLFRCDRHHKASLAWSPTLTATFHTPSRFGWLEFTGR